MKIVLTGKKGIPAQIVIAFILSIVVGLMYPAFSKSIKPLGDIFITLIRMIIVPVIFCTITTGIAGMGDMQKLKRVGTKMLVVYVGMTFVACVIGLGVGYLVRPGMGVTMATTEAFTQVVKTPSIGDFLLMMIPSNFVGALAKGDIVQVLVLGIFVGVALVGLGNRASAVKDLLEQGARVSFYIIDIIMLYSPIGVFALMANAVAVYGVSVFGAMMKYILADYLAALIIAVLVFILPLMLYARINIIKAFKDIGAVFVMATSTCSSAATLPLAMETATKKFKLPQWLVDFCLPLGGTVNSTGAAMYKAILIVFAADFYGLTLSIEQMVVTVLISTMLSVAAPGIPGGGIVMSAIMLNLMGLPYEIAGMLAGIYRMIDMAHTPLNVVGDIAGAILIGKSEGIWSNEEYMREEEA
ncbi:dicarboxylate/amino acid:cation symporter [Sporomusa paucivorans]|uniref:dicarboxylate/amino acid:cation symporter n=1 Tax=Sporomusa paucivorans TaxID=2376 RepID=UPI0035709D0B